MIILEDAQYSEAWWSSRLGLPTASKFSDIVKTNGEPSDSAQKYMYRLATEQITQRPTDSYQNAAMERGHEMEDHARTLFEMRYNVDVRQVGLVFRDEQRKYAASPDGLLINAGLEIFCPESPNHVACLLNPDKAVANAKKFQQIQGSMLISGFDKWHFVVYYPGMPALFQVINRDDVFCSKLEKALDAFALELAMTVKKIKTME